MESPPWLRDCTINVRNAMDEECFRYAVLAALFHETMRRRMMGRRDDCNDPTAYADCDSWESAPDFSMLDYPVDVDQLHAFESTNNLAINVFALSSQRHLLEQMNDDDDEDMMEWNDANSLDVEDEGGVVVVSRKRAATSCNGAGGLFKSGCATTTTRFATTTTRFRRRATRRRSHVVARTTSCIR